MRIAFWGTPELSVPFLSWLTERHSVVCVITQPDKSSGRSLKIQSSPVKVLAQARHLLVLQPQKQSDPAFYEALQKTSPDLGVVVSYGKIIPKNIFSLPKAGTLNIHFSLLPRFRGASPIAQALIQGDKITGVTSFWLDEGMDNGSVILQKSLAIEEQDDALTLEKKMITLGVRVLEETLLLIEQGKASGRPQEGVPVIAKKLTKEDGLIDWKASAESVRNLIRGTKPWPGAYTHLPDGKVLKIHEGFVKEICPGDNISCPSTPQPGQVTGVERGQGLVVQCGQGFLLITSVQAEGKKPMPAWEFWQGARLSLEVVLGRR